MPRYRVIIPTYQAGRHLDALLPALQAQSVPPQDVLVIDSSSSDGTAARFQQFGAKVVVIPQSEFNHGGTRRMAVQLCEDADFLVAITQDAIPEPGAFEQLLSSFEDPAIGMAYGRQLPRPQARGIERHARLVNYPGQSSAVRAYEDRARYGVKTTFSSNSFAAYRRMALLEVGNFPEECFFGEDQVTAAKLLMAGWKLAYASEAMAIHSHNYTAVDDFRRYFDIGVFHSRNRWLLESFGKAEGEGLRFVKSEINYLLRNEPLLIPSAIVRTLLKYAGYRIGMLEKNLSTTIKKSLSTAPYYWK